MIAVKHSPVHTRVVEHLNVKVSTPTTPPKQTDVPVPVMFKPTKKIKKAKKVNLIKKVDKVKKEKKIKVIKQIKTNVPKGATPKHVIEAIAKKTALPPKAIAAIVCAESSCGRSEHWDYSGTHFAYGKTQMSYGALTEIGWVPKHVRKMSYSKQRQWWIGNAPYVLRGERGLLAGALYLKNRYTLHKSVHAALRAYNQGDGGRNNQSAYAYANKALTLQSQIYHY